MPFLSKTILKNCLFLFKISYSCCFGLRGNLEFPDFLQNSFITSTTAQRYFNYFVVFTFLFEKLKNEKVSFVQISKLGPPLIFVSCKAWA